MATCPSRNPVLAVARDRLKTGNACRAGDVKKDDFETPPEKALQRVFSNPCSNAFQIDSLCLITPCDGAGQAVPLNTLAYSMNEGFGDGIAAGQAIRAGAKKRRAPSVSHGEIQLAKLARDPRVFSIRQADGRHPLHHAFIPQP